MARIPFSSSIVLCGEDKRGVPAGLRVHAGAHTITFAMTHRLAGGLTLLKK